MRRAVLVPFGVLAALNLGCIVREVIQGQAWYWAALSGAAFGVCIGQIVAEVCRGNREAARDRHDSDLATYISASTLALGAGLAPSSGTGARVKETTDDVPIIAYKRCHLTWKPGGKFALQSAHTGTPIVLDTDATCMKTDPYGSFLSSYGLSLSMGYPVPKPVPHDAPGLECTCGFYAVTNREKVSDGYGMVDLEVELSGRVIVHESGYRAQHQRVLRASLGGCFVCGEPVTAISVNLETSAVQPLCAGHVRPEHVTVEPELVVARLGVPLDIGAIA